MDNQYLTNAHKAIGENFRFVRDFKAKQNEANPVPTPPDTVPDGSSIGPFFLLIFQLLQQFAQQNGSLSSSNTFTDSSIGELPPPPPWGSAPFYNSAGPPFQNPAYVLINDLLSKASPADETSLSTADKLTHQPVQDALAADKFSKADLTSAMKYLLEKAPGKQLESFHPLLSNLMTSETLNAGPFLSGGYLDKLTPERGAILAKALPHSLLSDQPEQDNGRLLAFMVDRLTQPGPSPTKDFCLQFLQNSYDLRDPAETDRTLESLMTLTRIEPDAAQKLTFKPGSFD